jgi:hypothetical protein
MRLISTNRKLQQVAARASRRNGCFAWKCQMEIDRRRQGAGRCHGGAGNGHADDTDQLLRRDAVRRTGFDVGVLQRLSQRDQTSGAWAAKLYFDHLPHRSLIARLILRSKCCAGTTSRP